VMELVRGVRITDYCQANRLTLQERLGHFIQLCNAILHAHQKGIIHRDLILLCYAFLLQFRQDRIGWRCRLWVSKNANTKFPKT